MTKNQGEVAWNLFNQFFIAISTEKSRLKCHCPATMLTSSFARWPFEILIERRTKEAENLMKSLHCLRAFNCPAEMTLRPFVIHSDWWVTVACAHKSCAFVCVRPVVNVDDGEEKRPVVSNETAACPSYRHEIISACYLCELWWFCFLGVGMFGRFENLFSRLWCDLLGLWEFFVNL